MSPLKPISLLILLLVTSQHSALAAPSLYPVTKIIDGDTIDVQIGTKNERIRIIGMDTPETVDPRKPVQCFGKEASSKAKSILNGKKVTLESDPISGDRDKYGRLLRYVYLEDGRSFEKLMISEGYAHEYTYNSIPYRYQAEFKKAQKEAQTKKRGLWSPTPCNGNTVQAAKPATSTSAPAVKKSINNLCHVKGGRYYEQTKKFTPYSNIKACLASGGKIPG